MKQHNHKSAGTANRHLSQRYNNHANNTSRQNNRQGAISQSSPPLPTSGLPYGHVPAFLPGAASLVEQLDQRLMIVLRDGRHLVGVLRSFDQFSNMVLEDTFERKILYTNKTKLGESIPVAYYTDMKLGLYLVRGDSMVLLGEVNDDDEHESDVQLSNQQIEDDVVQNTAELQLNNPGHSSVQTQSQQSFNTSPSLMKKVSLADFEKLQEQIEKQKSESTDVDTLTWEFDTDLIV